MNCDACAAVVARIDMLGHVPRRAASRSRPRLLPWASGRSPSPGVKCSRPWAGWQRRTSTHKLFPLPQRAVGVSDWWNAVLTSFFLYRVTLSCPLSNTYQKIPIKYCSYLIKPVNKGHIVHNIPKKRNYTITRFGLKRLIHVFFYGVRKF